MYLFPPSRPRCCTSARHSGSSSWCPSSNRFLHSCRLWGRNTSPHPGWGHWWRSSPCPYQRGRRFLEPATKKTYILFLKSNKLWFDRTLARAANLTCVKRGFTSREHSNRIQATHPDGELQPTNEKVDTRGGGHNGCHSGWYLTKHVKSDYMFLTMDDRY